MRRADRLFQIVLMLGRGKILTAHTIAERLEVSDRTIYRDVQDLVLYRAAASAANPTAGSWLNV